MTRPTPAAAQKRDRHTKSDDLGLPCVKTIKMPKIYRTPKECERFLIGEFLCHLGYRVSSPSWQDTPDALVTLSKARSKKRVAVEHTEYFNDTVAGQRSPLTPYDDFWRFVQASLVRRISHRKHLTGISARVDFKKRLSKPTNHTELARQLAMELVDFVEAHPVERSKHVSWQFRGLVHRYPTIQSLLNSLILSRWTNHEVVASRCSWTCSNVATGHIGLSLCYIKTAIENKNKKADKYNWGDTSEKWLLIAASGATLSNLAGPAKQDVNWTDTDLMELCRNSPFDRIVFWERTRCWYKWLKPEERIMQYRNPYAE